MVEPKCHIFDNFQRSVPYITVTHISRVSKASSGFMMAYLHGMTVGISNKHAVNMKIVTRTLQTQANGKLGTKKVKKKQHFLRQNLFLRYFLHY